MHTIILLSWSVHSSIHVHFYCYPFLEPDTDVCTQNPDICGLGTCSIIAGGTLYECDCQDGAMMTGSNTNGTLTCIGIINIIAICLPHAPPVVTTNFLFKKQILMSACKFLTSVDLEHAIIMMVEHFMSAAVKMEQLLREPIPIAPSHVLVGIYVL